MRRRAAITLALAGWGAACSSAVDSGDDANAALFTASPDAALTEAFGPAISLAQDRSPAAFHGDFNGDGYADLIAFARAEGSGDATPAGVRVLRPWTASGEPPPAGLSAGADVMLAIVHGSPGGESREAFLLHDPDTPSILDTRAAREAFVVDRGSASTLNPEIARRAGGDILVLPTEAGIDTFLYWDGSTYRAYQPLEYP